MEKAKRARKAETPKQPSRHLRSSAPYFYPDCGGRRVTGVPTVRAPLSNSLYFYQLKVSGQTETKKLVLIW